MGYVSQYIKIEQPTTANPISNESWSPAVGPMVRTTVVAITIA